MNLHITSPKISRLRRYSPAANPAKSWTPATNIVPRPCGQFNAGLAHEVRNPLTNINLAVEMLKSTTMDVEQRMYVDIIMRSSGRVNDLITDLLTYNLADEIQPETHFIHQLLDEVLATTADRIMLKKIMVRKDYSTVDCKILVNKAKVKIALTNIIINAIDAMPLKGGRLKLVTKSINGECVIEIEDNGIGISKENLGKVFTPFFTNKPGGMGLGLSTTLEILESNHAKVDVQSEEGKGTKFILSFNRSQRSGKYLFGGSEPIAA
jgi:signal transduction histidine kinase